MIPREKGACEKEKVFSALIQLIMRTGREEIWCAHGTCSQRRSAFFECSCRETFFKIVSFSRKRAMRVPRGTPCSYLSRLEEIVTFQRVSSCDIVVQRKFFRLKKQARQCSSAMTGLRLQMGSVFLEYAIEGEPELCSWAC